MQSQSATVNVILSAILKASRSLIRDFGEIEELQVSRKDLGGFVSAADRYSEKILIQELQRAKPDYSIIAEEKGEIVGRSKEFCWIIDPLDGTTNFLHGVPHFAITVALRHLDEIIACVTYDPIKDEAFWAEKGMGAYLNQRRIRVSSRRQVDQALVGVASLFGKEQELSPYSKTLLKAFPLSTRFRRMGAISLDLAYVACGRFDVFFEEGCSIWDIASGILLVREAGGFVGELSGESNMLESGNILASNQAFSKGMQDLLKAR